MGRDFFDVLFLPGKKSPDFDYLNEKLRIKNWVELKPRLLEPCDETGLKKLSEDIMPFVFESQKDNFI